MNNMTPQEAIDSMTQQCDIDCRGYGDADECNNCIAGLSIKALDLQVPKKPIFDLADSENDRIYCPTCNDYLFSDMQVDYCFHCGQAIDWSKEDE